MTEVENVGSAELQGRPQAVVPAERIPEDFWVIETVLECRPDKLELLHEALLSYEEWLRGCRGWITPEDVRSRIIDFIDIIEKEV